MNEWRINCIISIAKFWGQIKCVEMNAQWHNCLDTIFQNVLTLCAKYYEHWTMFDETTPPKIWRVFSVFFLRHTVHVYLLVTFLFSNLYLLLNIARFCFDPVVSCWGFIQDVDNNQLLQRKLQQFGFCRRSCVVNGTMKYRPDLRYYLPCSQLVSYFISSSNYNNRTQRTHCFSMQKQRRRWMAINF